MSLKSTEETLLSVPVWVSERGTVLTIKYRLLCLNSALNYMSTSNNARLPTLSMLFNILPHISPKTPDQQQILDD